MDGEDVKEIEGECELAFQVTQICLHNVTKFFIVTLLCMYVATITPAAMSNEASHHVT